MALNTIKFEYCVQYLYVLVCVSPLTTGYIDLMSLSITLLASCFVHEKGVSCAQSHR